MQRSLLGRLEALSILACLEELVICLTRLLVKAWELPTEWFPSSLKKEFGSREESEVAGFFVFSQ